MPFPDSFLLLQQEGYLIRTSLAQGLTLLRSANLGEKGHFYGAFFGLSISLERLLKVITILDHMAANELIPPDRKTLKKYGHDLIALLGRARAITSANQPHPLSTIVPGSVEHEIVRQLGEFAESCGRYANLDALASGQPQSDPLANWQALIDRIVEDDVPASRKERARREAAVLTGMTSDITMVVAHDLNKRPLSVHQWFETPRMLELAASRTVVRVLRILYPLKELLKEVNNRVHLESHRLGQEQPDVPDLEEFLNFVTDDERTNLRKKRWP